jgi:hypothetical protein
LVMSARRDSLPLLSTGEAPAHQPHATNLRAAFALQFCNQLS